MDKAKLMASILAAREKLETTLSRVQEEQMTVPGAIGEWSVKDLLAHISVWERRMTLWLETTMRGEVPEMLPPGLTWDDLDQWNEQTYLELRDKPLEDVLLEFRASYDEALATVETVVEEDLIDPHRYSWRQGTPLWEMVAANMHWHYDEHEESISAWLGDPEGG
ncbi:MAG: ClbS/DfsB family four-helix bundle protein [Anaerolineales bacterium]|nr:ClbS/DfsB family four-helix bundle protein [Anaerolineales bacterium]